jgi:hypothetical protein
MRHGTCVILVCVATMLINLPVLHSADAPPADGQEPKTLAVKDARHEYDQALARAREDYATKVKGLRDDLRAKAKEAQAAYLKKLDAALDATLVKKDLPEANRIDALRKAVVAEGLKGVEDDPASTAGGSVYLSDMEEVGPVRAHTYGKSGFGGGEKIRVNGVYAPKGIFLHPDAGRVGDVKYQLPGAFRTLITKVGLNDTCNGSVTPVRFEVFGDGKPLWQSEPMQKGKILQAVLVPITGVKVLELRVESEGDYTGAHCVWVNPVAVR